MQRRRPAVGSQDCTPHKMSYGITGSGGAYASDSSGGASVGLPTGHIYECQLSWNSNSQVQISTGACRSDDDTQDMVVAATLTADITSTGANGRNVDTAEQADKWYGVYVIKNPTTGAIASFLINEDDLGAFTYPAGYTVKRRIGWIRNNSGSNFFNGFQTGKGHYRKWHYEESAGSLLALNAGSAVVFTNVDLSDWVPPTSQLCELNSVLDPWVGSIAYLRPNGSAIAQPCTFIYEVTDQSNVFMEIRTDSSQIIEYQVSNGLDILNLYVQSFVDEV